MRAILESVLMESCRGAMNTSPLEKASRRTSVGMTRIDHTNRDTYWRFKVRNRRSVSSWPRGSGRSTLLPLRRADYLSKTLRRGSDLYSFRDKSGVRFRL